MGREVGLDTQDTDGLERKGGHTVAKAKKSRAGCLFLRVMSLHPCWAEARRWHMDFNSPQGRFHSHLCKTATDDRTQALGMGQGWGETRETIHAVPRAKCDAKQGD